MASDDSGSETSTENYVHAFTRYMDKETATLRALDSRIKRDRHEAWLSAGFESVATDDTVACEGAAVATAPPSKTPREEAKPHSVADAAGPTASVAESSATKGKVSRRRTAKRKRPGIGGAKPKYPKGLFREARSAWKQHLADRERFGGDAVNQNVWLYDDWLPLWCEKKGVAIEEVLPEIVTGETWEKRAGRFWSAERQYRRDRKCENA